MDERRYKSFHVQGSCAVLNFRNLYIYMIKLICKKDKRKNLLQSYRNLFLEYFSFSTCPSIVYVLMKPEAL